MEVLEVNTYDLMIILAKAEIQNWIDHECELLSGQFNHDLSILYDASEAALILNSI